MIRQAKKELAQEQWRQRFADRNAYLQNQIIEMKYAEMLKRRHASPPGIE